MGKLRFLFALWMAKLSVPALKITRHNGTDFPGTLALKLCPDFLKYVGRPKTIIAVTGTNGKTTVSNLLADTLEKAGPRVLINRAGSNVASGIATALLKGCDLAGRVKDYDMAVLEVDERSSVRVYPYITPDYIAVTNLFRDSIMRNAHADFIADIISRSVPAASKLVLNADDLISCGLAPENPRVYFGIDRLPSDTVECVNHINDVRICPKCAGKLRYEYRRCCWRGCTWPSPSPLCTSCCFCSTSGTPACWWAPPPPASWPLPCCTPWCTGSPPTPITTSSAGEGSGNAPVCLPGGAVVRRSGDGGPGRCRRPDRVPHRPPPAQAGAIKHKK